MNVDKLFTSKFIRAADIEAMADDNDNAILTIANVRMEEVGQDQDEKPCIFFEELDQGLVLNKTNATTIKGMFGSDTDAWTGKRIALFTTEVDYQGKQSLGIRVRMKMPKATKKAPVVAEEEDGAPF